MEGEPLTIVADGGDHVAQCRYCGRTFSFNSGEVKRRWVKAERDADGLERVIYAPTCPFCGKEAQAHWSIGARDDGHLEPRKKVTVNPKPSWFVGGSDISPEKIEPIDMVNHPPHYQAKDGRMECIEWIEEFLTEEEHVGYLKGQVLKYLWRYDDKGKPVEDLEKSRFYLDKLIEAVGKKEEGE